MSYQISIFFITFHSVKMIEIFFSFLKKETHCFYEGTGQWYWCSFNYFDCINFMTYHTIFHSKMQKLNEYSLWTTYSRVFEVCSFKCSKKNWMQKKTVAKKVIYLPQVLQILWFSNKKGCMVNVEACLRARTPHICNDWRQTSKTW